MNRLSSRHTAILIACIIGVAACGAQDSTDSTTTAVAGTVAGVGVLPDVSGTTSTTEVSTSTTAAGRVLTIGEVSPGPRLLMIGDSILAALSRRYGNLACDTLVPMGWRVSVEAERGRFIDLGVRVVDKKLPQGFDAAVVFLGTNYGRDQAVYERYLDQILDGLAPRPVIIFTVTEYKPHLAEVNEVVEREAAARDNLWLVDWRTISEDETLLWRDGIHPVDAGNRVIMDEIVRILGDAPGDEPGKCLPSEFTDDVPLTNLPSLTTTTIDPSATTLPGASTTTVASEPTTLPSPTSSSSSSTTSTPAPSTTSA